MSNPWSWSTNLDQTNANSDGDINWSENQAASTVNDSARNQMASHARFYLATFGGLTTTGGALSYALTTGLQNPVISYRDGLLFSFKAHISCGDDPTLNVDSQGPKKIYNPNLTQVKSGTIQTNRHYEVKYDASLDSGNGGFLLFDLGTAEPDVVALYNTKTGAEATTISAAVKTVELTGYSSPGDGGGALYRRVDSEPSHAGKFRSQDRFISDGTEDLTNGGWWEISEPIISVLMFGAVGDGAADDTTAIQNAVNAAIAAKGLLYFPSGTYKTTATITLNGGVYVLGDGLFKSIIACAADVTTFSVTSAYVEIERLHFEPSVTKASGAEVHFTATASSVRLHQFYMKNYYLGIIIESTVTDVNDGQFRDGVSGAAGCIQILNSVSGPFDVSLADLVADYTLGGTQPSFGINIRSTGDTTITNVNIIRHTNDLLINPDDTYQVASGIYIANSFFDTATRGILMSPINTGVVQMVSLVNVWCGGHTGDGMRLDASGVTTGGIGGITAANFIGSINGGSGITAQGPNIENLSFTGGGASGNTQSGAAFTSVTGLSVSKGVYGPYGRQGANTAYGLFLGGACENVQIEGNNFNGNAGGPVLQSASGTIIDFTANSGYEKPSVNSSGVTTFTITNQQDITFNNGSTVTVTLPAAATYAGRKIRLRSVFTGVVSATANVVPINGGAPGTAILTSSGNWAELMSDGTNWQTIQAG